MATDHHREAIEALGMRTTKNSVINKLKRVIAHSTDTTLQNLAAAVIRELDHTSTRPNVVPAIEMNAVPTARKLMAYCQAYTEDEA